MKCQLNERERESEVDETNMNINNQVRMVGVLCPKVSIIDQRARFATVGRVSMYRFVRYMLLGWSVIGASLIFPSCLGFRVIPSFSFCTALKLVILVCLARRIRVFSSGGSLRPSERKSQKENRQQRRQKAHAPPHLVPAFAPSAPLDPHPPLTASAAAGAI